MITPPHDLCYVAGPITDNPDYLEDFDRGWVEVRALGYTPLSPLDVEPYSHDGPCPTDTYRGAQDEHDAGCYMRTDIAALLQCSAIYLLDGWPRSAGARCEYAVARALGLVILYQTDPPTEPRLVVRFAPLNASPGLPQGSSERGPVVRAGDEVNPARTATNIQRFTR